MVYIIRKRALGDVLWIEPIIRKILDNNKKVLLYTKYPQLFLNFPSNRLKVKSRLNIIEKLVIHFWPRKLFGIEVHNLEMSYENDPKKHLLFAYQKASNLSINAEYPRLYLSQEEMQCKFPVGERFVVLHLESFSDKNFRKVYNIDWKTTVSYLQSRGFEVVLVGSNQMEIPGAKFLKTSIRELIALIHQSQFFIGIDSGPSHIAASLKKPALVFFGAVNPNFRHFTNIFKGFFLQQPCEFSGCYHETISTSGPDDCRLVGSAPPPCCIHSNEYLKLHIDKIIETYL